MIKNIKPIEFMFHRKAQKFCGPEGGTKIFAIIILAQKSKILQKMTFYSQYKGIFCKIFDF
jgi:hypothetical protein